MKRVILCLFSTGWMIPAWLGTYLMMTFLQAEVWPRLRGEDPSNSFPFIHASTRCLVVAFVWLALVGLFWSWRLAPLVLRKPEPPSSG